MKEVSVKNARAPRRRDATARPRQANRETTSRAAFQCDRLAARVRELARHVATLAPLTLAAIKEGARRVSQAFALRDAEDLLLSAT